MVTIHHVTVQSPTLCDVLTQRERVFNEGGTERLLHHAQHEGKINFPFPRNAWERGNETTSANAKPCAVVLSEGATASTDYFLFPYLAGLGYEAVLVDSRHSLPASLDFSRCGLLVISRYVQSRWLPVLKQLGLRGVRLVYFMDDDLFEARALCHLPWRYQWKIISRAWFYRSELFALCAEFWVSTDYLVEKYARLNPVLLRPVATLQTLQNPVSLHVCYHGSASHSQEIEWLIPIVHSVQAQVEHIHFEFFAARGIGRLLKNIPRVSVLQPMSWPNYLAYTASQRKDIALAPLLPGFFNAARGATKFLDYARMGAVGIYSDVAPYRGFINEGVDGILLANDPRLWVDALLELARDNAGRHEMAAAVKRRAYGMVKS